MSRSIHFNDVDLSGGSYGLTLLRGSAPLFTGIRAGEMSLGRIDGTQAAQHAWDAKSISCFCLVSATSNSALKTQLDAIAGVLNERQDRALWFDTWNDRYWNARLAGPGSVDIKGTFAEVELDFIARDPMAYAISASTDTTSITGDAQSVSLVTAGSAWAYPVYTLTANTTITATIVLENEALDLRLSWSTGMASGGKLQISTDPRTQLVELDPTGSGGYDVSMAGFSGYFPPLRHATTETIRVSGFRGSMKTDWRNRYL